MLLKSQSTYKKKEKEKKSSTLIFSSQPPHDLHTIPKENRTDTNP